MTKSAASLSHSEKKKSGQTKIKGPYRDLLCQKMTFYEMGNILEDLLAIKSVVNLT